MWQFKQYILKEERKKEDVIQTLQSFYNYYTKLKDEVRLQAIINIYKQLNNDKISIDRAMSQLLNISRNGSPESLEDYHNSMSATSREEIPKWDQDNPIQVIRRPKFAGINRAELEKFYEPNQKKQWFALKNQ